VTAACALRGASIATDARGASPRSATIAAMHAHPARTVIVARTPRGFAARACAGRRDARCGITAKAIKTT
jgi:hypothetical protein